MKNQDTYLDGYAALYESTDSRNEFGAKTNDGELSLIAAKVPFYEMSHRQSDLEFAEQQGFSISRKIKIQYCQLLTKNKKYKVKIDDSLYDLSYFDATREAVYLYLEYIREVTD